MKVGNEGSENKVGFEAVLVKRPELTQLRGDDAMLLTKSPHHNTLNTFWLSRMTLDILIPEDTDNI